MVQIHSPLPFFSSASVGLAHLRLPYCEGSGLLHQAHFNVEPKENSGETLGFSNPQEAHRLVPLVGTGWTPVPCDPRAASSTEPPDAGMLPNFESMSIDQSTFFWSAGALSGVAAGS